MNDPTNAVTPRQLAWLEGEVRRWQADGLVAEHEGAAILEQYAAVPRAGIARLMLYLGGAFVGFGVMWLVAANLDQLSPLTRLLVVAAIWLGITGGAELLAGRRGHRDDARTASPVVGAARGLAALAFGAVIFQSAQSLQVPAYEPALVGWWALGALVYAYAARGVAPLVVALAAGLIWLPWHLTENGGSVFGVTLALVGAAAAASGVALLHDRVEPHGFGAPWREVGAAVGLAGLFMAAVPDVNTDQFALAWSGWLLLAIAIALALGAAATARGVARLEPLAALGVMAAATWLVVWDPELSVNDVSAVGWLHAGVSIAVYVGAATWVAVVGLRRGSERLTYLALAALVAFTTFQSFAVFAQIIQGAWLFLALGLVFVGTGFLFDRARRELAAAVEGASA